MNVVSFYNLYLQFPHVQTDTRKLKKNDIYFSLKGENFNGNEFAESAINAGAAFAIIDEAAFAKSDKYILVPDVLLFLQELATYHREQLALKKNNQFPIIAITGSNGKTTTKELIHVVLQKKYKTQATIGNLNNHIGVPLTLLAIKEETEIAIVEMGANHLLEIASYCQWAKPNYALINNCGKAHLEGFGSEEGVRKGKGELYDYIRENGGVIFRNADYDYLNSLAQGIEEQITYGEFQGDTKAKIYKEEPFLEIALLNAGEETLIKTHLVGRYNLPNVLAAITIGKHFGVHLEDIKNAIENYIPSNNRSQHLKKDNINIILDAYNANPSSMKAAISSFASNSAQHKILMLGAMREMGDQSKQEHEDIVNFTKQFMWKAVVFVGTDFEGMIGDAKNYYYFASTEMAKEWFNTNAFSGDWVYIKGSRLTAMEKIIN